VALAWTLVVATSQYWGSFRDVDEGRRPSQRVRASARGPDERDRAVSEDSWQQLDLVSADLFGPEQPRHRGTLTGTIIDANALATTGTKRGDLPAMIQAVMSGDTYVNVHTTKCTDGEIRGEIETRK
jgi:hypothetical protein